MQCNQTEHSEHIKTYAIKIIKENIKRHGVIVQIYVNGKVYVERKHYAEAQKGKLSFVDNEYISQSTTPVYGALQLLDLFDKKIEKIKMYSWKKEILCKIEKELLGMPQLKIQAYNNVLVIDMITIA